MTILQKRLVLKNVTTFECVATFTCVFELFQAVSQNLLEASKLAKFVLKIISCCCDMLMAWESSAAFQACFIVGNNKVIIIGND